jgi:hypothetical protein
LEMVTKLMTDTSATDDREGAMGKKIVGYF